MQRTLNCSSSQSEEMMSCQWRDIRRNGRRLTLLVVMEILEEVEQLVLVPPQDVLNLRRLLRIRDEHLNDTQHQSLFLRMIFQYLP